MFKTKTMKNLILILAVVLISCKKEKDAIPVQTGSVSFYNGDIRELLTISVNSHIIGKTSIKPLGYVADCSTDWAVKYSNKAGFYTYQAINIDSILITSGSFELKANDCLVIALNH